MSVGDKRIHEILGYMSKELAFNPLSSFVDINFWQEFSGLKLDKLKLDDKPIVIFGTYTPPINPSAKLFVLSISENCLPGIKINTIGGLIESKVQGIFYNANTFEQFVEVDKKKIASNSTFNIR
jgi:ubiquitin-like modifier-activating enzyme ATG7